MNKEFFYSIAFRNVFGGNTLQNRIALKPVLHHAKAYGCQLWGYGKKTLATTKLLRTKKIVALRKLLKNGLFRAVNSPNHLWCCS